MTTHKGDNFKGSQNPGSMIHARLDYINLIKKWTLDPQTTECSSGSDSTRPGATPLGTEGGIVQSQTQYSSTARMLSSNHHIVSFFTSGTDSKSKAI